MPIEPPPSPWDLASARLDGPDDLVAVGADLEPGTVLSAYRLGLFPMGLGVDGRPPVGWWSPLKRGVLRRGEFHTSRSLRRSRSRFEVTVNSSFDEVMAGCADPDRSGRWITTDIQAAYRRLHLLGWAHSVEVWLEGQLVGGLYGVCVGGLFAGESMFHRSTDASKVALLTLSELVFADRDDRRVIDVQWQTPHLKSLGTTQVPRAAYLAVLREALLVRTPEAFAD